MKLAKTRLQLVMVLGILSVLLSWLILPSYVKMSLIDVERRVGNVGGVNVTTGDVITIFALFGTTVTIAVWLSMYFKTKTTLRR